GVVREYRIGGWGVGGFFVVGCWAVYFAIASKDIPIDPVVSILARLTCPIAIAGAYFPISCTGPLWRMQLHMRWSAQQSKYCDGNLITQDNSALIDLMGRRTAHPHMSPPVPAAEMS